MGSLATSATPAATLPLVASPTFKPCPLTSSSCPPVSKGPIPTPTPTPAPTPTGTAQPQVIHVGFVHGTASDQTYGAIAYYAPTSGTAAVIKVAAGSQVVFLNDDTGSPHTGSGLGTGPFPASFDNTSGTTASGSTIDGSLTWSTGTLVQGAMSNVFTVGPPGAYYFGCAYHYNADHMRDVLVSM